MRIYTVHLEAGHLEADGTPPEAVLIEEGFNWPAFVFSPLWALWHGMWGVALLLVGVMAGLGLVLVLVGLNETVQGVATLGLAVIIGGMANDLRRRHFEKRGFTARSVVAAEDREAALHRYLEVARSERAAAA